MRRLLSIVIAEDDDGQVVGWFDVDPALSDDHDLDRRVSLAAQAKLAAASEAFSAELEATTHFVENLERMTREITDKLTIADVNGDDLLLP